MGESYNPLSKLPKNIRQIGERDQVVKLYVEDYVNTYLKHLYPSGGQDLRVGVLLGSIEMEDGMPYIFIDGAIEMEDVEVNGEKIEFTESGWKKAYQSMEEMFPKKTVQGWFLCGTQGSQLSPLNYWKQHMQYFQGANKLMYLNYGLEGDESIYITSEDGFYKLRGHSIYYERNQMMQDYMVLRKDIKKVESGASDTIIRDFRQRMEVRKEEAEEKHHTINLLSGLCTAMSVVILAGAIVMFNNYGKMKQMESVIASVVPQRGTSQTQQETQSEEELQVVIEEADGGVFPTTEAPAESLAEIKSVPESSIVKETMESTVVVQTQAVQAEVKNKEPVVYTVGDGETLYGICLKIYNNLSKIDEICKLNGLEDENRITSGQKLILP